MSGGRIQQWAGLAESGTRGATRNFGPVCGPWESFSGKPLLSKARQELRNGGMEFFGFFNLGRVAAVVNYLEA